MFILLSMYEDYFEANANTAMFINSTEICCFNSIITSIYNELNDI